MSSLIHDLYEYAKANDLGTTPFKKEWIDHRLVLGSGGVVRIEEMEKTDLLQSVDVLAESRTGGTFSYALRDTPEYVLGTVDTTAARAEKRFESFWKRTEQMLAEAGDAQALMVVKAAMRDQSWKLSMPKLKGRVGLAIEGDDRFMIERSAVVECEMEKFRVKLSAAGDAVCLVTGNACDPVLLHDRIEGVPGTGGATPLISFNQKTAADGLEQGLNFPICLDVMKRYTSGLNQLLETSAAILSKNTCAVFWGPSEAAAIAAVMSLYTKWEPRAAAWAIIESMRGSTEPLHVAFFKGSKSRIAVLSYEVVKTCDVVDALLRYRDHFAAVLAEQRWTEGDAAIVPSVAGSFKWRRLERTKDEGKKREFDGLTIADAVKSVLFGRRLPRQVTIEMINMLRPIDIVGRRASAIWAMSWLEFQDNDVGVTRRTIMKKNGSEEPKVEDIVVVDNDIEAYHLGRLIAMIASLRRLALRRTPGSDKVTEALELAGSCPASYAKHFSRDFEVYSKKATGILTRITLEIWQKLKGDLVRRTVPLDQCDYGSMVQGYMNQTHFNRERSKYLRKMRKMKEKAAAEKAAAEKAAAAETQEIDSDEKAAE